jgi:pimeloyl-ACP methyl ester carboxylesterase
MNFFRSSLLFLLFLAGTGLSEVTPEKKGLPFPGETLAISNRQAFLIPAGSAAASGPKPWVWYAPTLPGLPGGSERWMFERLLAAGIAIAGIDVGESYGSPEGRQGFSELYLELTKNRGYATKPVLLARSRGGLMTLGWAVENPDKVAAWAGIYPVSNIASYPGIQRAAPSFKLTGAELTAQIVRHNPVDRLEALAKAGVPLFAIHGDSDKVVPLELNSGLLRERYQALSGAMELVVPPGQGHNMWSGFFECEALVAFVIKHVRPEPVR